MAKKVVSHSIAHIDLSKPITTSEQVGEVICARRTSDGITIQDAAALCGVAKDTLLKIENGHDGIKLSSLLRIFSELGIELHLKLKGTDHDAWV
jgi:transcriptional regulator with XRE-family HTH domain